MYEVIHNFMEVWVPTEGEEGTSPIVVAKTTNIKYDPALLLRPPGCMVHVSLTSLGRLLQPLNITDGEVVIPTKTVKGKTVEVYYEYAKPQEKSTTGESGWMWMTTRQEGQQSVRDILSVMNPSDQTLKDIGITMTSKALLTQTNVKVWGVSTELKELASGSHLSDWQTERNTAKFNRDLGVEDGYNPDSDRSIDVEETYCVM